MIKTNRKNGIVNVNPTLIIGRKNMELSIQVCIDGEVIIEKKSDSLLSGLLKVLMGCMGGIPGLLSIPSLSATRDGVRDYDEIYGDYGEVITGAETYSGTKTKITSGTTTVVVVGDYVMISGLTGDWSACNGYHQVVDDISATELSIDVNSSAFGALGLAFSPQFILLRIPSTQMPSVDTLRWNEVWLGKGNTVVNIDDRVLADFIGRGSGPGQLDWIDATVVPSVIGINGTTDIVTMTFSRDFTNNSGATIAIEEAGLFSEAVHDPASTDNHYYTMLARDLISTTILDGGIVTVNYRIRTSLDAEGGFLAQMLEAWAAQARIGTIINIENSGISNSAEKYALRMAAPSGDNRTGSSVAYEDAEFLGPQIGTGVTAVGVEDYAMETRIAHGNGSLLTVSGTTGNLIIDIDTVDYSEAFSTDVEETIDNWLATHTATLAGLGIPIIATKESASAIRLVTTDSIVFTDDSTGDMAFVVAGEMKIYGCLVENLLVNTTPGEASFDIVRIFENNSGALITVSEVGMYYSPDLAPYTEQYCISRHVLAAPIAVADGELLKLTHTIKVVL